MASAPLYRRAIPAAARVSSWHTPDGWPLRRFDWTGSGRGSILFQGGRGDIFEKYIELFVHWHAQGWSVTSFDWRGQGGSGRLTDDPLIGHIDDFGRYIDDLHFFWRDWQAAQPGPHVLMGHSMGGHLVLRAMVEGAVDPAAAVLSAPMLGLKTVFGAGLGERVARLLGNVGNSARPAWRTNEKPGTSAPRQMLLTYDADRYADELWWREAKPELQMGPPSWRWVIEAFGSTRRVRTSPVLKDMRVPTLFLVPLADALVDPRAALAIAQRLPEARVVKFGDESAHEVLREADPVRNRAIGEIDIFLSARAQRG